MANYDDWLNAVLDLLNKSGLTGEHVGWSWRDLYKDNVKPKEAVEDYVKWLDMEAE